MTEYRIARLSPNDAQAVTACFKAVYGDSYANEIFYHPAELAERMRAGKVNSVGAKTPGGAVIGHMAMTTRPEATTVELGNTVVDPQLRGRGIAWEIGAELSAWAQELGYTGYVHYPTTDHHIMQRQSVKNGFETGLMLGYIPNETDARMSAEATGERRAATIVYQPYTQAPGVTAYVPEPFGELVETLRRPTGLLRERRVSDAAHTVPDGSQYRIETHGKRGLVRLTFARIGRDSTAAIEETASKPGSCRQIDFLMDDARIGFGVAAALDAGYRFCGWLPGFAPADTLRMQNVDPDNTDMQPALVNPTAQMLLDEIQPFD